MNQFTTSSSFLVSENLLPTLHCTVRGQNEQVEKHDSKKTRIKSVPSPGKTEGISTLILFYKQHMIKKTSWTFLDFIQSLLIFVA